MLNWLSQKLKHLGANAWRSVMAAPKQPRSVPTSLEFLLNVPIYDAFSFATTDAETIARLEFFDGHCDLYCIRCQQESTFKSEVELPQVDIVVRTHRAQDIEELIKYFRRGQVWANHITTPRGERILQQSTLGDYISKDHNFTVELSCTRNGQHRIFFFRVEEMTVTKVGQSPSIADLKDYKIKKYRKILGEEKYRELSRAVGLHSHGVGIGAFIYLRRIFEMQIIDAHNAAKSEPSWDEDAFVRCRMDEKILMLKQNLPTFLVENRAIYGILSKGVHELTEQECLDLFDPVRLGIEMILDQKMEMEEKQKKAEAAQKAISELKTKLS
jgi:organic radical activating enzyme